MNTDNRHENSGHENVSWWINNDEGLYRMAMDCIRYSSSKDAAARAFLNELEECGLSHSPDGASYKLSIGSSGNGGVGKQACSIWKLIPSGLNLSFLPRDAEAELLQPGILQVLHCQSQRYFPWTTRTQGSETARAIPWPSFPRRSPQG